jgi:hypothetical protein
MYSTSPCTSNCTGTVNSTSTRTGTSVCTCTWTRIFTSPYTGSFTSTCTSACTCTITCTSTYTIIYTTTCYKNPQNLVLRGVVFSSHCRRKATQSFQAGQIGEAVDRWAEAMGWNAFLGPENLVRGWFIANFFIANFFIAYLFRRQSYIIVVFVA